GGSCPVTVVEFVPAGPGSASAGCCDRTMASKFASSPSMSSERWRCWRTSRRPTGGRRVDGPRPGCPPRSPAPRAERGAEPGRLASATAERQRTAALVLLGRGSESGQRLWREGDTLGRVLRYEVCA